nr:ADM_HP1_G0005900.mRNA.1.CDS.1 [Saccharomyces cerevisiae]
MEPLLHLANYKVPSQMTWLQAVDHDCGLTISSCKPESFDARLSRKISTLDSGMITPRGKRRCCSQVSSKLTCIKISITARDRNIEEQLETLINERESLSRMCSLFPQIQSKNPRRIVDVLWLSAIYCEKFSL